MQPYRIDDRPTNRASNPNIWKNTVHSRPRSTSGRGVKKTARKTDHGHGHDADSGRRGENNDGHRPDRRSEPDRQESRRRPPRAFAWPRIRDERRSHGRRPRPRRSQRTTSTSISRATSTPSPRPITFWRPWSTTASISTMSAAFSTAKISPGAASWTWMTAPSGHRHRDRRAAPGESPVRPVSTLRPRPRSWPSSVWPGIAKDLKERLGRIVVGYHAGRRAGSRRQLKAQGAMAALLKDAIRPNLVQTLEGSPAFIHGGPFANIAHGTNSVIATHMALSLADYVVTETRLRLGPRRREILRYRRPDRFRPAPFGCCSCRHAPLSQIPRRRRARCPGRGKP